MKSKHVIDRRRFFGALGVTLAGCGTTARPEANTSATATATGPATEPKTSALRDQLAPYVERDEVPGLVASVLREGREEALPLGVQTLGKGAMERDSIFRIASMSKPITAAAVMILVEEGKLKLDEPVDRLLPELAHRKVLKRLESQLDDVEPAKRAITVDDLLTFRAGFGLLMDPPGTYPIQKATDELGFTVGPPQPTAVPAPDEWMRRLGTLPLLHQPGEQWRYNTGADVLGVLVARASGKPFDVFLRERLFEPLAMPDTDFSVPASKLDRLGTVYFIDPKTKARQVMDGPEGQWSKPPAFPSGAGGLVSTAADVQRFGAMLLRHGTLGRTRVLSPESVKLMTTDKLTAHNKSFTTFTPGFFDHYGWGYGMAVVTSKDELGLSSGSFGWFGGMGTTWHADPSKQMSAVLLTNQALSSPEMPPVFKAFYHQVNGA